MAAVEKRDASAHRGRFRIHAESPRGNHSHRSETGSGRTSQGRPRSHHHGAVPPAGRVDHGHQYAADGRPGSDAAHHDAEPASHPDRQLRIASRRRQHAARPGTGRHRFRHQTFQRHRSGHEKRARRASEQIEDGREGPRGPHCRAARSLGCRGIEISGAVHEWKRAIPNRGFPWS